MYEYANLQLDQSLVHHLVMLMDHLSCYFLFICFLYFLFYFYLNLFQIFIPSFVVFIPCMVSSSFVCTLLESIYFKLGF